MPLRSSSSVFLVSQRKGPAEWSLKRFLFRLLLPCSMCLEGGRLAFNICIPQPGSGGGGGGQGLALIFIPAEGGGSPLDPLPPPRSSKSLGG